MRELNCVVMPSSQGWFLSVGGRLHGCFNGKDQALRAAIIEAQKGRAAGLFSTVKVQHGRSSVQEPFSLRSAGCSV
jgi:hypothetical protein